MTMKQLGLFCFILWTCLLGACVSEPIPSETNHVVGRILTRNINTEEIVSKGQTALFNIFKAEKTIIENQIFTYDGEHWKGEKEIPWTDEISSATLTAFYPAQNGDKFITESPYTENELMDVKIAKTNITDNLGINLNFNHLFSKLTFNIQEPLRKSIVTISLTTPKVIGISSNGNLSISETEVYTTTLASNNGGTYSFITPPLEDRPLTLSLTLKDKEQPISHPLTHTFESGKQYECNVKDREKPGILTPQEFIDFSQLYNNKSENKDFSMYGELQEDGRWLFRLLADIDFSTIKNTEDLKPIGYNENRRFIDTFDGEGHSISNIGLNYSESVTGLFGRIDTFAVVKNVHLIECSTPTIVSGISSTGVGLITGVLYGTITNCSVTNGLTTVTNGASTGGIVGIAYSGSKIINSYTKGLNLTSNGYVGGIVGHITEGKIINCYSTANTITRDNSYSGGFCGYAESSYVTNSYVYNNTLKTKENIGQFIGYGTNCNLTFCYTNTNTPGLISNKNSNNAIAGKSYDKEFQTKDTHIPIVNLLNQWISENQKDYNYTFTFWTSSKELPAIFDNKE